MDRSRICSACTFLLLGALVSCTSDETQNQKSLQKAQSDISSSAPSAIYRLRNEAKLHADRHSEEGYVEGAALYDQIIAGDGASWTDYLNRARCLVFTPQFAEAESALEGARSHFASDDPPAAIDYVDGLYHKRIDEHESAALLFAKAVELSPGPVQAWYQKGFAEERIQHWEDARMSYDRSLQIDPSFRAAAYRLVIVLRQLNLKDEERAAFARFNAMSDQAQPDPEKCVLTRVSLRPAQRSEVEPPPVDLVWREVVTNWAKNDDGSDLQRLEALQLLPKGRIADLDNDGAPDLVMVGSVDGEGDGQPRDLQIRWGDPFDSSSLHKTTSTTANLDDVSTHGALELYDLDHDGDLDLVGAFSVGRGPIEFSWYRNNGDRTFSPTAGFSDPSSTAISFSTLLASGRAVFDVQDFDLGNDLDVVVAGGGVPLLLMNLRDGAFRPLVVSEMGEQDWVRSGDLNNDGLPDLFAINNSVDAAADSDVDPNADTVGGENPATSNAAVWTVALHAESAGHAAKVEWRLPTRGSLNVQVRDVVLEDVDNDADLDAVLATSRGVIWLRNTNGTFAIADEWSATAGITSVRALDLNGDGQVEVVAVGPDGLHVLAATHPSPYPAWVLRPTGGRDNLDAVGVIADQYAGSLYQTRMIKHSGGVRFGLGQASLGTMDGVRLRWPQGIVQPEGRETFVFAENAAADSRLPVVTVIQEEGLVASCPFLYARGPNGWTFLTDVVGIAPLDEWLPAGETPHLDPEEYVRIDGSALVPSDGRLHLVITEELRETTYLDRLELVCVEHDAASTLWIDESSNQGAYDPLRVLVFRTDELSAASAARFDDGTEATEQIAERDGVYAHGYARTLSQWSGWVDRYGISMTAPAGTSAILLTGRIGWYDSTVSYALNQHGRTWGPLQLLRKDTGQVLVADLGLPAGMDRTMASLFAEPLPADSEIVLSGHHRFLWDRILFAPAPVAVLRDSLPNATVRFQILPLRRADLGFHGYSRMVGDRSRHEQTYVFADASPDDSFSPAFGKATRYGDVLPLLTRHDDELVVLVAGDKVELEFDAPGELAEGRARTFFLRTTGWAKEGSFHNQTGRWILPLPFRAMSSYPPPTEELRQDAEYRAYLQKYQIRETAPLHAGSR